MIGFPLRMAWRETRAAWREFVAFFACIALGVGALVGVGTFGVNLDRTLGREARAMMGGDVEVRATRPFERAVEDAIDRVRRQGALTAELRDLVAMAREPAAGASLLVEVKAVDGAYPLYGRLETEPPAAPGTHLAGRGALVDASLLERLGLRVGDGLLLGAARLTIRGVLVREPDRATGFLLGPRVLVSRTTLDASGLVQVGSRVRYRVLLRLPEAVTARAARAALAREIEDPAVRVTAFDEAQPGLRRFFTQMTTYLGLVGLASLLVGGIGVAAAVRAFIRRRRDTIAVLKCLGASSRLLVVTYLVQTIALGLLGSAAGALLGLALQPAVARLVEGVLPLTLETGVRAAMLVRGVAMGVLTAALVGLWPLLEIRTVPPSAVLRRDVDPGGPRGRRPWGAALPIAAGLIALAFWQAGSLRVGAIFVGATLAALLLLVGLSRLLVWSARRLPRLPSLAWRQGLANLARPGGHAVGVIVALGMGVMLLVAVSVLEAALDRQLDAERRVATPSFFFVDVQTDQAAAFARLVREQTGVTPELVAVVRARLAAVRGEPVTRALLDRRKREVPDKLWYYTRDYAIPSFAAPPPRTTLAAGRWWTAAEAAERPRLSIDDEAAHTLGVGLGDTLTFDVQGVPLEAEVMSLRKVDWQTLTANFFVIVSPGPLDGAPATVIGTARVPPATESRLQDTIVAAFPNVIAVPVRDVLERVGGVLDRIALAVRAMALFSVATGLVVLVGTLAASRYQRLAESAILRTLGATRGAVARIFAVEYAAMGTAAGLGGAGLAAVLAWAVLRFVLDVPWQAEVPRLLAGVATATAAAVAVGFFATFRLLGAKPLPVLRRE
ncbi:MAG: ABC transporter permease [Candidatus Rokubacteria bacterium]|nr:ABC transporter permease [Candidatus Rokubacteria bacterium]